MGLTAGKSGGGNRVTVNPAAMDDILKVLARHNPGLSKAALKAVGRVMAAVSTATARLTVEQQRQIASLRISWPRRWRPWLPISRGRGSAP
ncbi:hypothetical protein BDD41_1902 [Paracoccus versutus]|uniref:Uncharacterized protein n=1 Tax=Paracoccus versutus TaxID=34007 RepID=A0A3D9XUN2_PARVE|nr:hypothetical protein BDD41_1902 [Paracoccus versutus]